MGFTSQDDLINQITVNGKTEQNCMFQKVTTPAHTAGGWHLLAGLSGTPPAWGNAGTTLTWQNCNESTGDGTTVFGIQHGGNVSTATKHAIYAAAMGVMTAGLPGIALLIDMIGYYKLTGTDVTGTGSRTLTGTPTHRYTNGVGCRAFFCATTAPTGGGPNLTASSYTNSGSTAGRAFQGSPSMGAAADAYATRVINSGTASGRYNPFLPLQAGDVGVKSVESFTFSGGTAYTGSGVLALVIAKPLVWIPMTTTGVYAERDLVNQVRSMPQIKDGACLTWMFFASGATTNSSQFLANLDVAWGG